jgi:tRNA (adenine57-N1/adenine58-N1)-methyltransferase
MTESKMNSADGSDSSTELNLPIVIYSGKISYIVNSFEGEFHTHKGVIDLSKIKDRKYGDEIETHLGHKFKIRPFSPSDFFTHFRKGPTPIMPKDIGAIIAFTGLRSGSSILDCGTGSGVLSAYLAYFNKDGIVVTIERRPDFANIARRNFELAGLRNIYQIIGDIFDIYDSFKIKFDLITLDMKNDVEFIPFTKTLLKQTGYLVVYNPYMDATREVYFEMLRQGFEELQSFQLARIDLEHKKVGTRPFVRVWHTGYIVIGRKIS